MRIGLLGYGKMGKLVERVAEQRGHEILVQREPAAVDVAIDFSVPNAVLGHIEAATKAGIPLVIGTTAWDEARGRALVEAAGGSCLFAPNFSLGVQRFRELVRAACRAFAADEDFDVALTETHHRYKLDAPSGTAKALASDVRESWGRKAPVTSIRCGEVPGTHELVIDGPFETLRLTHTARSREMWALGAVQAAEWLPGKQGFFTLEDWMEAKLCAGQV